MEPLDGVYFRREDYAGFWRRLAIDVADIFIAGFACAIVFAGWWLIVPSGGLILASWAAALFGYFVVLKRSKAGTVGYRLGRVRIVGLDGQRASVSALTVRLLFGVLGPFNWFLDLI